MAEKRTLIFSADVAHEGLVLLQEREAAAAAYDDWLQDRYDEHGIDPDACESLNYNPFSGRLIAVLKELPTKDAAPGT